jgi:hypothetical protein
MPVVSRRVLAQVSEQLGLYVYLLVDPRDGRPFYVGKGRGVRMMAHGLEARDIDDRAEHAKAGRIRDIRASGLEHEIWIARYGLTTTEYTAVEAALIDVLASFPIVPIRRHGARRRPLEHRDELTNRRREDARGKGLVLLDRLVDELAAPELTVKTPLLLITIKAWGDLDEHIAGGRIRPGYGFKREWHDPVLRDRDAHLLEMATSSWWVVKPVRVERLGIEHAVPVYHGVTRGLLRVRNWEQDTTAPRRWGFVADPITSGKLFDEVVGPHGHRVPGGTRGRQNPLLYWPRG